MSQISLEQIPQYRRLTLAQVMDLERIGRQETYNRFRPGDPGEFSWAFAPNPGPGPKRIKIVDAQSLSPAGREKWLEQIRNQPSAVSNRKSAIENRQSKIENRKSPAPQPPTPAMPGPQPGSALGVAGPLQKAGGSLQSAVGSENRTITQSPNHQLSLIPVTPLDRQMLNLRHDLPSTVADVAVRRFRIVQQMKNCNWKAEGFDSKRAFLEKLAAENHTTISKIYRWSGWYDERGDLRDLVSERPGPDKGEGSSLDADSRAHVLDCLLLRRMSVRESHGSLVAYLTKKQTSPGCSVDHLYNIPSYDAVARYWRRYQEEHKADVTLAREGSKAFADTCGRYLSRKPPEFANDVWVTDQRLVNVRLRDGGEKLGRIWLVNFLDVCTWKWLGCAFGPVLSSDMVMRAAAMAIGRYGVPKAIHEDQGKEFQCTAFNGRFMRIKGETLFKEVEGVWERLGVRAIAAIGRNPKSKIIERWHAVVDSFDRRFAGWTGANTDERPEELAVLEAEHERWKKTGEGRTRLLPIRKYIERFYTWCETEWNAGHRGEGKYLRGQTPNEAWNTRRPPEGFRTLSEAEIEFETSDRRTLQVARGGQINVTLYGKTVEYESPELFGRQGQTVLVLVSRRSLARVGVYEMESKEQICEARLKPQFNWLPEDREELRAQIRCDAALHRAVRMGLQARRQLAESQNPAELAGPEPNMRFISGAEWMMDKSKIQNRKSKTGKASVKFANERADSVLAAMGE